MPGFSDTPVVVQCASDEQINAAVDYLTNHAVHPRTREEAQALVRCEDPGQPLDALDGYSLRDIARARGRFLDAIMGGPLPAEIAALVDAEVRARG